MTLTAATTILGDKYTVIRELGRGAFAHVWLAQDNAVGGPVAIKELRRSEFSQSEFDEQFRRFQREARIGRSLRHPNIVEVYTVEQWDGDILLVMEYVPGETLAERLARQGTLSLEADAEIGIQLCDALEAVHSHSLSIVHRDMKPSNVLLAEGAGGGLLAKLTDFGLAQLAGESGGSTGRRQHHPGTPSYMAPEQEVSAGELSGNADLYALGLTLGEALTGQRMKRRLLDGESNEEILAGQPAWLIEALARATHENRRERYQRAGNFKKTLEDGLKGWIEAREREKQKAAELERQARMAGLYAALTTGLKAGKWAEAIQGADEILALDPGYRDAARLRARAQAGLRAKQEQTAATRQKEARLATLYREAEAASQAGDWAAVLACCRAIEGLQAGYRDVTRLRAEAEEALRRRQEQQTRAAAAYGEARRLLRRKQYQAALDKLGEVRKLDPAHPDIQRVAERAQAGLAAPPRPPWWIPPLHLLRRAARPVGVLLVLVLLGVAIWRVAPLAWTAVSATMTRQAMATGTPISTQTSTTTPSLTPSRTPMPIDTPIAPTLTDTPTYTVTSTVTATETGTPTPSVTPTVTPSATLSTTRSATPTTPTPSGPTFTVSQPVVNVREGPGTSYQKIGTLKQGDTYEVTGRNAAGDWWQFDYGGKVGWVSDSVAPGNGQAAAVRTVVPPTLMPQPTPTPAVGIGSTTTSRVDGMTMVLVPQGSFQMGGKGWYSTSEEALKYGASFAPQHEVYLDDFWIDQTEVTNAMYRKCEHAGACSAPKSNPSETSDGYYTNASYDNYPVIFVSWFDAERYCRWAGRRLPTEAEWEKAARGPNGPKGLRDLREGELGPAGCNCCLMIKNSPEGGCSPGHTTPVGSYSGFYSPYGALDLIGNVWEWVADWFDGTYYQHSPSNNPQGPDRGPYHALRGTAWNNIETRYEFIERLYNPPEDSNDSIGFRCAMSASHAIPSSIRTPIATTSPTANPTKGAAANTRLSGKIAYFLSYQGVARADVQQSGVYVVDLPTNAPIFVGDYSTEPSLSQNGTKLVYIKSDYGGAGDVVVVDLSSWRRDYLSEGQANESPALSSNGSRIAYVNGGAIYIWENGVGRNLTAGTLPTWSPDGAWIAYCGGTRQSIYKIANGGGPAVLLTDIGTAPAWGADHKIVYARDNDIWVMNEDGTGQSPLTTHPGNDYQPAWSPDGTKIIFVSERDGNVELYTMNADGSEQTRLTNTIERETKPSWSR